MMDGAIDYKNNKMNKTDKKILVDGISSKTSVLQRLLDSMSDDEKSNIHYIDQPLAPVDNSKMRKFHMNCRHIKTSIMLLPPQPLLRLPLIGDDSVDSKVREYNQIVDRYNEKIKII
jgi:hypothetical protein